MQGGRDSDLWFALDKLEHFILSALAVITFYLICIRIERLSSYRIIFSFFSSLLLGVCKEVGDFSGVSHMEVGGMPMSLLVPNSKHACSGGQGCFQERIFSQIS